MQRLASAGVQLTTMMPGSLIREVAGKVTGKKKAAAAASFFHRQRWSTATSR
jgi:hypothetical protein